MNTTIRPVTIKEYKVVRMGNKTLVFLINGEQVYATRRVANKLLSGECELFFIEFDEDRGLNWLSYPSRF